MVIITRTFPVGDFDFEKPSISEPHRIYKTIRGWRVFYTGRIAPDITEMRSVMKYDGADLDYIKVLGKSKYYTARLTPKIDKLCADVFVGGDVGVVSFLSEKGKRLPEWSAFIDIHDKMTNANNAKRLV